MHADITAHLQALVEIAVNSEYRREVPDLAARVQALERRRSLARSPVVRTIAALGCDAPSAWVLRYAVGRFVAWRSGHETEPSFTLLEARYALRARLGPAARLAAGIESGPLSVLRTNGILVRPGRKREERTRILLSAGFGEWVLGGAPGGDRATPAEVPDWQRSLPAVAQAGAALAASLGVPPPPVVVLRTGDSALGLAVAAAAAEAQGRDLAAWRVQAAEEAVDDPLPALAWAGHVEGHDVAVAMDGLDREWGGSVELAADLQARMPGVVLWVVAPLGGGDAAGLTRLPRLVDLDPLRARIRPEDLCGALPGSPSGAASVLDADAVTDLAELDRVARWMPLNAAVHGPLATGLAASLREVARLSGGQQAPGRPAPIASEEAGATLDELVVEPDLHAELTRLADRMRSGARCVVLLHGPPGTGKSFAARCLAGSAGLPVLPLRSEDVRGQFFGQEEGALAALFASLRAHPAVLVVDEADAWFGRREGSAASIGGCHIIECSDLLTRLERYRGAAVLTTNRSETLDPALHRRVDAWIHLGFPDPTERMALWVRALEDAAPLAPVDLAVLSAVPVAGGDIVAVVREVRARHAAVRVPDLVAAARARARRREVMG